MEQNTNKLFGAVGAVSIGALLLGGGSVLAKENLLPKIPQAFEKMLEDKNNVKSVEEADGYIVAKIRDEDKSKNESAIYIFLTKKDDGTLTIHHTRNDGKLTTDDEEEDDEGYKIGSTGELYIPDEVNGVDITEIGEGAFQSANFTKLKLPKKIKQIGSWSFSRSNLTGELSLPESIEAIGEGAFYSANFSGKLRLPSQLKEISSYTFTSSKFTGELFLPENIKSIGIYAFRDSTFTGELNLPQNIEYIEALAFINSTFTGKFEARSNLKIIDEAAFAKSNFTGDFEGFESLEEISGAAFEGSHFNGRFVTPSKLKKIVGLAFTNSRFTGTLDLFNISTIENGAFDRSLFTQVNNPRNLPTTEGSDVQEDSISDTAIHLSTGEYYSNKSE